MASDLRSVEVVRSPLSNSIYLARFGKQEPGKRARAALDKRDAEAEVVTAVVEWVMHESPKGAVVEVTVRGKPLAPR